MRNLSLALLIVVLLRQAPAQYYTDNIDKELYEKAKELSKRYFMIDTHIDLPGWLYDEWIDVSQRTEKGEFDFERAKEGGLNLGFMAIYTSPSLEGKPGSKITADSLITLVELLEKRYPDKFSIIKSVKEAVWEKNNGKILLAMGMENGSPISGDLKNLQHFYNRGIRYITLAHYKVNHISDSANDPERKWNGLSLFGKEVVKEMNRLGIMVDVSHISDSTFYDILKLTKAPVMASHSCCRFFTPGYERNMSDEMIKALAQNGGVIQINFANFFLRGDINKQLQDGENYVKDYLVEHNIPSGSSEANEFDHNYWKEHPLSKASVIDVADQIDHVKKLVGIDFVGIGSDFNGVGGEVPLGLEDISKMPTLIYELLKRNYSDEDIEKLLGKNLIRVWKSVEEVSGKLISKQ